MAKSPNAARSLRDAIIDAAEELWGLYGLDGVTLQQITAAAKSNNSSAVQYHFGSRDGLIEALYKSRVGLLEQSRARLLAEHLKINSVLSIDSVLNCLFRPFSELRGKNGKRYHAAFQARIFMSGHVHYRYKFEIESPVTDLLTNALRDHLSYLSQHDWERRIFLSSVIYWQGLVFDDDNRALTELDRQKSVDELLAMMRFILTLRGN